MCNLLAPSKLAIRSHFRKSILLDKLLPTKRHDFAVAKSETTESTDQSDKPNLLKENTNELNDVEGIKEDNKDYISGSFTDDNNEDRPIKETYDMGKVNE